MLRTAAKKVAWVGRTASMAFGLALVLALVFGAVSVALGATGGNFLLGKRNVADAVTTLIRQGPGPALSLVVESNRPPMTVNAAAGKATNLNADKVDGMEGDALAAPRGYAHVTPQGTVDNNYPARGIGAIIVPEGQPNTYCFDLAFAPNAAVGAPHPNNAAFVSTATQTATATDAVDQNCPNTHRDAVVKTYGTTGAAEPINFQIVFE